MYLASYRAWHGGRFLLRSTYWINPGRGTDRFDSAVCSVLIFFLTPPADNDEQGARRQIGSKAPSGQLRPISGLGQRRWIIEHATGGRECKWWSDTRATGHPNQQDSAQQAQDVPIPPRWRDHCSDRVIGRRGQVVPLGVAAGTEQQVSGV